MQAGAQLQDAREIVHGGGVILALQVREPSIERRRRRARLQGRGRFVAKHRVGQLAQAGKAVAQRDPNLRISALLAARLAQERQMIAKPATVHFFEHEQPAISGGRRRCFLGAARGVVGFGRRPEPAQKLGALQPQRARRRVQRRLGLLIAQQRVAETPGACRLAHLRLPGESARFHEQYLGQSSFQFLLLGIGQAADARSLAPARFFELERRQGGAAVGQRRGDLAGRRIAARQPHGQSRCRLVQRQQSLNCLKGLHVSLARNQGRRQTRQQHDGRKRHRRARTQTRMAAPPLAQALTQRWLARVLQRQVVQLPLQILAQRGGRWVALRRIGRQAAPDDRFGGRGDGRVRWSQARHGAEARQA